MSSLVCNTCNKQYKTELTLQTHIKKCIKIQLQLKCDYCILNFNSIGNYNKHIKICKDFIYNNQIKEITEKHTKELEEINSKYITELEKLKLINITNKIEYDKKLLESKLDYDNLFKRSQIDYSEYEKCIQKYKKDYKELDNNSSKMIKDLTYKIKSNERESKLDKIKIITYADEIIKLKKSPTTMTNNININNTIKFESVLISGKLDEDSFIKNEDQMVNHIVKHGITNCFRVTDKKRNTITWIDENGKEIKDSNAIAFAQTLSDAMTPDMIIQKDIAEKRMADMQINKRVQDINYIKLNEYQEVKLFSDNIISKQKDTMLNLGKKIAKVGTGVNEHPIKYITMNIYSNFTDELDKILIDKYEKWIVMNFYDFGVFLKREMKLTVIKEANNYPLYIIIKNNNGIESNIFGKEVEIILKQIMNNKIINPYIEITLKLLINIENYNEKNIINMIEWVKTDILLSDEDIYNTIMEGILYG